MKSEEMEASIKLRRYSIIFLGGVHRARTIIQGKSDKRSGMSWVTFLAQRPDIPIGMFVGFFGLGQLLLEQ